MGLQTRAPTATGSATGPRAGSSAAPHPASGPPAPGGGCRRGGGPCTLGTRPIRSPRRELLAGTKTASEVAALLGTSRQTPHDRLESGTLIAVYDRGAWRFP